MNKGLVVALVTVAAVSLVLSVMAYLRPGPPVPPQEPAYAAQEPETETETVAPANRYTAGGRLILEFLPGFRPSWYTVNGDLTVNGYHYPRGTWEHLYKVDMRAFYSAEPYPSEPLQDLDPNSPTFGEIRRD